MTTGWVMVIKRFKTSSNFIPPLNTELLRKIPIPFWLLTLVLLWLMPMMIIGFVIVVCAEVSIHFFQTIKIQQKKKINF
jgi:hypothetical protein